MGWGSSVSLESKEGQGPRCRRPPLPTSPPYIQTGWTFQASHDKDEAAGPRVSQQAVGGGGERDRRLRPGSPAEQGKQLGPNTHINKAPRGCFTEEPQHPTSEREATEKREALHWRESLL